MEPLYEVALLQRDQSLHMRLAACAALEHRPDPDQWAWDSSWALAAQPGWGGKWAEAIAAGNPDPGRDPAVITDGMILSAIQGLP